MLDQLADGASLAHGLAVRALDAQRPDAVRDLGPGLDLAALGDDAHPAPVLDPPLAGVRRRHLRFVLAHTTTVSRVTVEPQQGIGHVHRG